MRVPDSRKVPVCKCVSDWIFSNQNYLGHKGAPGRNAADRKGAADKKVHTTEALKEVQMLWAAK